MERQKRKNIRLRGYDYSTPGWYFITICTKNKEKLLCDIVGTDILGGPKIIFTEWGNIVNSQLIKMRDFYSHIKIDRYIVMPNHVHLILHITEKSGPPGRSVPTNSVVSDFVGTFKRFTGRQIGANIWQNRSNDHIIRGEEDYLKIAEYIENNPYKWKDDCFYCE
ncbi:MAG: transposase [Clostridia bacterium]|nr:transposase [Clostridia bacterium]